MALFTRAGTDRGTLHPTSAGRWLVLALAAATAGPQVMAEPRDAAAPAALPAAGQNGHGAQPAPQLVKDIQPGEASSNPELFTRLGDIVFFRANDGEHGVELWTTDGTAEGTQLFIDLLPGPLNGVPGNLTAVDGDLFFYAFTETTGSKVFRSDGTRAGTHLLADTFPGAPGGPDGPPLPAGFTRLGNNVLFAATDAEHGYELWTTDGTSAGTRLLKDIHPGAQWSVPVGITVLGNAAYFGADDSHVDHPDGTATFDRELFATDGTADGTGRVIDINPGPLPSTPVSLTRVGGQLLFRADDGVHGAELWLSDGSAAGTRMLADINPAGDSNATGLTVAGNRVFFAADDGTAGVEPWVTDGTPAGTRRVRDINPAGSSSPTSIARLGDRVVFAADDGEHGRELWISDGTEAGTRMIADLNPGPANGAPREFVAVGGRLFFTALADADAATQTVRTQLWTTDGTEQGTRLVWEAPGWMAGYAIRNLTLLGGFLLFSAPAGTDADGGSIDIELYRLDLRSRFGIDTTGGEAPPPR